MQLLWCCGQIVWLERLDENQVNVKLWARIHDNNCFTCIVCNSDLKYSSQGFQAFQQHSQRPNKVRHLKVSPSTSTSSEVTRKDVVKLDGTGKEKVSAAKAMWVFKMAKKT